MVYDFELIATNLTQLLEDVKDPEKNVELEKVGKTLYNVRQVEHAAMMSLNRIGNLVVAIEQAVQSRKQ